MRDWLNIGCGTHRAPEPWVNVDVVDNHEVHPDVLRIPGKPLPFRARSAEKVYAGHVLEHMPWPDVPKFVTDLRRVLAPGGELMVVGPDVLRTLHLWKQDREPWFIVEAVLEQTGNHGFEGADADLWPNARHWWNCHEARVADMLTASGLFSTVETLPAPDGVHDADGVPGWPVVGFAPWQFAVRAVR